MQSKLVRYRRQSGEYGSQEGLYKQPNASHKKKIEAICDKIKRKKDSSRYIESREKWNGGRGEDGI